ncbi:MAG: siderophore-interacting protein [Paraglaciecola sp.]|uniref:siderophore-interacting protein n=1 Tax=Paraglaciecola sp. TaxID=1920173 RepID=UPI003296E5AF
MTVNFVTAVPQKIMHEIIPREVLLSSIQRLNEDFVRLVFCGSSLHSFSSPSFDDHVKLVFDNKDGKTVRRNYTPIFVSADRGKLTIDIALHEGGEAMTWLNYVKVGDIAVIAGPRMSLVIHDHYAQYWFVSDATALPAINRKLLSLP